MPARIGVVAIVEDDAATRKSLERLLQANAYATTAFASAEDFLQADAGAVVILVLDIHLGGMSGIELCRRLQAAGSRIPVVFITAHDDDATRAAAIVVGCIDFLQKPFEADRLISALERGMTPQRTGRSGS